MRQMCAVGGSVEHDQFAVWKAARKPRSPPNVTLCRQRTPADHDRHANRPRVEGSRVTSDRRQLCHERRPIGSQLTACGWREALVPAVPDHPTDEGLRRIPRFHATV